jgi:protein-S-isoprenylcysteine O-methyltransferase Ste14
MMKGRPPPLLVTFVLAALMWGAARAWPQLSFDLRAARMLAAVIALAGIAVCVFGVASFRRAQTTVDPRKPAQASALVASGVYRLSRNPMYLGFLLLLVAWGVYLSYVPALLLAPAARSST